MMAQSAVGLGVPLRLLAEGPTDSAAQVISDSRVGDYRDLSTLRAVADGCAVVTFDHEHVPTQHLVTLTAEGHACRPGPSALVHVQDKAVMRSRLSSLGVPVAAAAEADFRRRLSALVARSPSGQVATYPVVEWAQRDGSCIEVIAPAPEISEELAVEAQQIAMTVASALDVTGILAVELLETTDGRILVDELAMRPHDTGHWTIDGAVTSQFENHLRAVLDLPLGAPEARAPWTVTVNILGGSARQFSGRLYDGYPHVFARDPRLKVHLYGKDVKPGELVGHVTAYGHDLADVLQRARHAAAWFQGDLGNESE